MQHVNNVADRGQVDDPVSARCLTYPDLANAGPTDGMGFQSEGFSPI
jgi:hypothetical protein